MAARIDILAPFNQIKPGPFISRYQDWILFTLLLFFFWAVAGIALRKKFEESRHLRVLVTVLALILAVGTYFSVYQGWLHFSLQGFGFIGAILVFIMVFFLVLGLMRGYGMPLATALSFGFAFLYISLWAISPNILHTLADTFPPANGILLLLFIVSVVKLILAFFRFTKSGESGISFSPAQLTKPFSDGVDEELIDEKRQRHLIKDETMKMTRIEIKTIEHIERYIKEIIEVLREEGARLSKKQRRQISKIIIKIQKSETIFKKGLSRINEHLNQYQKTEKKDLDQLKDRMSAASDPEEIRAIREEIVLHQKMLEAEQFMQLHEKTLWQFIDRFNEHLIMAVQKLKSGYPQDSLANLQATYRDLVDLKPILKQQSELEDYLLKLNRKVVSVLEKEKSTI